MKRGLVRPPSSFFFLFLVAIATFKFLNSHFVYWNPLSLARYIVDAVLCSDVWMGGRFLSAHRLKNVLFPDCIVTHTNEHMYSDIHTKPIEIMLLEYLDVCACVH